MHRHLSITLLFAVFAIFSLTLHFAYDTTPVETGKYLGSRFAAGIGMNVKVPSNPINTLASRLEEREEYLDARERELNERETALLTELKKEQRKNTIFLFGGMLVILSLLILNFYFDYHRRIRS